MREGFKIIRKLLATPDHRWILEGIKEKLGAGRIENVTGFSNNGYQLVVPVGHHNKAIHLHVVGTALKCAYGPEAGVDLHSPDSIDLIVESIRKCIRWSADCKESINDIKPVKDIGCPPCPLSSQLWACLNGLASYDRD